MAKKDNDATTNDDSNQVEFSIQRIFVKDSSFESPNSPEVFSKEWKPDVHLDMKTEITKLENNEQMVVLTLSVTTKSSDDTAFVAEVQQAGIFTAANFTQEQMSHLLSAYCPTILFPYARENIATLVMKGGFPPLHLAPVNFDALYEKHLEEQAAKEGAS